MDNFGDIKFIFVAKSMLLSTTMSYIAKKNMYHYLIWPKFKMAAIFRIY